jgi:hypothetical protein
MSKFFESLSPIVRVIESEEINSYFEAIIIYTNTSVSTNKYKQVSNKKDEIISVEEDTEFGEIHIDYNASYFFNNLVRGRITSSLIEIDRDFLQSENREGLKEKLHNHLTYVQVLLNRFERKSVQEKNILAIIPVQLKRIQDALIDRLNSYKNSPTISTGNITGDVNNKANSELTDEANKVKIKWLSDDASLVTLFGDLLNGNIYDGDGKHVTGKKYIMNTKEQIIDFIHNNFLNKDNLPVEKATIQRCLKTDKLAKRNRIYLQVNLFS